MQILRFFLFFFFVRFGSFVCTSVLLWYSNEIRRMLVESRSFTIFRKNEWRETNTRKNVGIVSSSFMLIFMCFRCADVASFFRSLSTFVDSLFTCATKVCSSCLFLSRTKKSHFSSGCIENLFCCNHMCRMYISTQTDNDRCHCCKWRFTWQSSTKSEQKLGMYR